MSFPTFVFVCDECGGRLANGEVKVKFEPATSHFIVDWRVAVNKESKDYLAYGSSWRGTQLEVESLEPTVSGERMVPVGAAHNFPHVRRQPKGLAS